MYEYSKVAFFLSHVKIKMNGFADHGLDEGAFGEAKGFSAVKAFDAFRKSPCSFSNCLSC